MRTSEKVVLDAEPVGASGKPVTEASFIALPHAEELNMITTRLPVESPEPANVSTIGVSIIRAKLRPGVGPSTVKSPTGVLKADRVLHSPMS
jgi:hypothetical protein